MFCRFKVMMWKSVEYLNYNFWWSVQIWFLTPPLYTRRFFPVFGPPWSEPPWTSVWGLGLHLGLRPWSAPPSELHRTRVLGFGLHLGLRPCWTSVWTSVNLSLRPRSESWSEFESEASVCGLVLQPQWTSVWGLGLNFGLRPRSELRSEALVWTSVWTSVLHIWSGKFRFQAVKMFVSCPLHLHEAARATNMTRTMCALLCVFFMFLMFRWFPFSSVSENRRLPNQFETEPEFQV